MLYWWKCHGEFSFSPTLPVTLFIQHYQAPLSWTRSWRKDPNAEWGVDEAKSQRVDPITQRGSGNTKDKFSLALAWSFLPYWTPCVIRDLDPGNCTRKQNHHSRRTVKLYPGSCFMLFTWGPLLGLSSSTCPFPPACSAF